MRQAPDGPVLCGFRTIRQGAVRFRPLPRRRCYCRRKESVWTGTAFSLGQRDFRSVSILDSLLSRIGTVVALPLLSPVRCPFGCPSCLRAEALRIEERTWTQNRLLRGSSLLSGSRTTTLASRPARRRPCASPARAGERSLAVPTRDWAGSCSAFPAEGERRDRGAGRSRWGREPVDRPLPRFAFTARNGWRSSTGQQGGVPGGSSGLPGWAVSRRRRRTARGQTSQRTAKETGDEVASPAQEAGPEQGPGQAGAQQGRARRQGWGQTPGRGPRHRQPCAADFSRGWASTRPTCGCWVRRSPSPGWVSWPIC
jgi:hypothetical protein